LALVQLVLSTHQQMVLTQLSQQLLQQAVALVRAQTYRQPIQAVQVQVVQDHLMQVQRLVVLVRQIKVMQVEQELKVRALMVRQVAAGARVQ
jgi:hypothetical protein